MKENNGTRMTREEVVRKVAALLRLAARPGTAGEAAAAAAKAQEMLDRYELTRGDVQGYADKRAVEEPDEPYAAFSEKPEGWLETLTKYESWRVILARAIGAQFGCFVFRWSRGKGESIEVVGRPSQVESVRYLYAWLAPIILRLSREHGKGLGGTWRREFREGAGAEIGECLKRQRQQTVAEVRAEANGNPHAIMCLERGLQRMDQRGAFEFARQRMRFSSGRARSAGHSDSARAAGARAARDIDLSGGKAGLPGRAKLLGGGQ